MDLPYVQGARILLWLADFFSGNWDNADATAQAAPRLGELGTLFWEPYLAYLTGLMAAASGDDAGVAGSVDRLLATADAHDARLWRLYARHVLTVSAAGRADFDAAYRHASAISPAGALAE